MWLLAFGNQMIMFKLLRTMARPEENQHNPKLFNIEQTRSSLVFEHF